MERRKAFVEDLCPVRQVFFKPHKIQLKTEKLIYMQQYPKCLTQQWLDKEDFLHSSSSRITEEGLVIDKESNE